ncbi:CRISPR-associated protein [Halorhodospira halochloris]|uniref:CRISPR system Cms protein Csm2 n=1 Tax=Halorhodospira halochloris TaxID=1052 RepID=A0A0X8XBC2_HALHR|nr:type III-A CRISPR-associated protein Csm2 [Halorhodospira halochloris]MBK1651899.1 type III-A CRISPR-associated protein Csm2 [Halorhodospira halochloris]BAU58759.1 CRISPR-associated protein [Halorhodospira halochloris]
MNAANANHPRHKQQGPSGSDPATIRGFIEDDQADQLVATAERLGQDMGKQVSTSQVRNIFSSIKRLEMREQQHSPSGDAPLSPNVRRELLLLKPRLAYATARENRLKPLHDAVTTALDVVAQQGDQNALRRLSAFYEAIVAYHQYHGGK